MFNWDNKNLAEVLEMYGGNIFAAEMDYRGTGLDVAAKEYDPWDE